MSTAEQNFLWGRLIVEELSRCGLEHVYISPGSRSTPLALAIAACGSISYKIHYDERGTAFAALGHARATGKPVAVVCTSGTAAANFYPALIEASLDNIPLVLITADRPPELRDVGANQTIRQPGMFADYVRWQFDLPCPDAGIDPAMVLTTVDQAIFRASGDTGGPVHINCMFREPLVPEILATGWPEIASLRNWINSGQPFTQYATPEPQVEEKQISRLVKTLSQVERGLLLVGHLPDEDDREAAMTFAEELGWPLLADITSGLATVGSLHSIRHYNLLMVSEDFRKKVMPKAVLHLGGRFVSKRLLEFLQSAHPGIYAHASESHHRQDPSHRVTHRVTSSVRGFCQMGEKAISPPTDINWLQKWQTADGEVADIVSKLSGTTSDATEISVARTIAAGLPETHALFLASSMPIRAVDIFAASNSSLMEVAANRAASGIDGTVASAAGYAAGCGKPVTLLIGDLALLHDLNSLALLIGSESPVTVVVINNNGGGIFEHLSIAQHRELCQELFVTPHDLSFQKAAEMFRLAYLRFDNTNEFAAAYSRAMTSPASSLIEVTVDRTVNLDLYQNISGAIEQRLAAR